MLKSKSEKAFDVVNSILMVILLLIFAVPYLLIITTSFTDETMISVHGPSLLIRKFSIDAYAYIFASQFTFVRALLVSVYLTLVTTALGLVINSLFAYALSRRTLLGKKFFNFYLVFTMLFSGGMIPGYLIVTGLGLKNSLWAIILPAIVSAWNVILIRNYFYSIPESLAESAKIDGANNVQILLRIYVPISTSVLATISLFTAVAQWNNWSGPLLYIDNLHRELYPIQYLLREMLNNLDGVMGDTGGASSATIPSESVKNAAVIVATLPIICVYPFLQKYFINGVIIGSVKE